MAYIQKYSNFNNDKMHFFKHQTANFFTINTDLDIHNLKETKNLPLNLFYAKNVKKIAPN